MKTHKGNVSIQKCLWSSCCAHPKSLGFSPMGSTRHIAISCIISSRMKMIFRFIDGSKQLKTCISNLGSEMRFPDLLDTVIVCMQAVAGVLKAYGS